MSERPGATVAMLEPVAQPSPTMAVSVVMGMAMLVARRFARHHGRFMRALLVSLMCDPVMGVHVGNEWRTHDAR